MPQSAQVFQCNYCYWIQTFQTANQIRPPTPLEKYHREITEYIDKFLADSQIDELRHSSVAPGVSRKYQGQVTYNLLVGLNKQIKTRTTNLLRLRAFLNEHIKNAIFTRDIIVSKQQANNTDIKVIRSAYIRPRDPTNFKDRAIIKLSKSLNGVIRIVAWLWFTKLQPFTMAFLGAISAAFSIIVLFGELANFLEWRLNLMGWMLQRDDGGDYFKANLIAFIPLGYMLKCAYFGLFKMKVTGIYALHWNKQTDPSSLLFSCT